MWRQRFSLVKIFRNFINGQEFQTKPGSLQESFFDTLQPKTPGLQFGSIHLQFPTTRSTDLAGFF